MRWPFRKRAAEADIVEPVAAESVTAERPQAREWTALSPLPGTFSGKAPLVIGPAPVLPPLPGRREPMPASDPELRGSVQGIASVIKPVRFDRSAADVVHRPPRRRAVVLPQAPEPEPLTYVDEQHVEEPREPRVPHRAPAWLRYTPPPWAMSQNDEPGIPDLPLPLPIMDTPPPPPPAPVVRPKPERRASLAQSRRLGLGAPISPAQPVSAEEEPAPEEPAPAVVMPAVSPVAAPVVDEQPPLIHESVPSELAASMRQTHNVDVADVPVVRGKAVSAEARSHGARAFTRGGKVHLPDEAGPLTSPKARGLIAHELVHAVQQRTLGLSLPSPSSEHGQALEAEAVAVERFYAGESNAPAPQPLIHSPRVTPMPSAGSYTQLDPISAPATTPTSSEHQQVIDARVREEVDRVATDTARRVVQQEWQNPTLTAQQRRALGLPTQQQQQQTQQQQQEDHADPTAGYLEAAVLSRLRPSAARHAPPTPPGAQQTTQTQQGPLSQTTATAVQPQSSQGTTQQQQQQQEPEPDPAAGYLEAAVLGRLTHHGHHLHRTTEHQDQAQQPSQTQAQSQSHDATASPTSAHSTEHAATTSATGTTPAHHHVDINDLDLEELSARLYSRLRSRLRLELLVDRERAGQLTDYR
jgi:hypothetical protein